MQQLLPLIGWRLLREPRVQNRQQLSASVTVSILTITVPEKHDWHSFPETTWFGNRCSRWRPSFVGCYERSPRWGNLKHFLIKYNLKVRFSSSLSSNPLSQENGVIHGREWKAGARDTLISLKPLSHTYSWSHMWPWDCSQTGNHRTAARSSLCLPPVIFVNNSMPEIS